jgi:D-psicose/D-tagatose/L-ribulose 3-epimerase
MKFGVNVFIWSASFDASLLPLLPRVKEWGFDGIEVPLINPREFQAEVLRKGLADNGLEATACSVIPGKLSLISESAEVRGATIEHLTRCIEAAASVGIKIIAGPLYSPVGYLPGRRRNADEWSWAVEGYQALLPVLDAHDVTLCIEPLNRFETYFLNTTADAVALMNAVDNKRIRILFDTFHANIEEKDVAGALLTTGGVLAHVHTCENDRGTPGSGHVPWSGVRSVLDVLNYDGWLTIESFGFALGELSAAASIWRDLAPSPDDIARDGVKYLRGLFGMRKAKA